MKIRYTPRAIGDLAAIADHIRKSDPLAADRVGNAIEHTIGLLSQHPDLGVERPELGVRKIGVPRYSYSVFYRVKPDTIEIAHIRDDRRKSAQPGDV